MASLKEKAIMVDLNLGMYSGRRYDPSASSELNLMKKAESDVSRVNKLTVPKPVLAGITSAMGNIRSFHYDQTLPWTNSGLRMLPAANFFAYTDGYRTRHEAVEREVERAVPLYMEAVEHAARRMGELYNPTDYPSVDQFRSKFRVSIQFLPFPDAEDFRVSQNEVDIELIKKSVTNSLGEAFRAASIDLAERATDVLTRVVERLNQYEIAENGKVLHPFRDSLIGNVRELVDLIPKLNIMDDPAITKVCADMGRKIGIFDPEQLRSSEQIREVVVQSAEEMIDDLRAAFNF